jgi:hypothetical protein
MLETEAEIIRLFEDGDRALMSANVQEITRIYSEDYLQADENGNLSARDVLIRNLTSGAVRFVSMTSTGRHVRLLKEDLAIVHGSEDDEIVWQGRHSVVHYIYMDVVMKRSGRWQIAASQLARRS